MTFITHSRAALVLSLGFLPAACAQRSQPPASSGMSGMPGMKMDRTDMQAMMSHCAQMRGDKSQARPEAANMQAMMSQCDQMDRAMPTGGMPATAPAPAATLSR